LPFVPLDVGGDLRGAFRHRRHHRHELRDLPVRVHGVPVGGQRGPELYAAFHGVDALLDVPLLAHQCDNPICQNPRCWRESNHRANGREYAYRRDVVRGALTDTRGARGRARAVRDAARAGSPISEAVLAGLQPVHLDQIELFTDATNSSPGTTGPGSSTPPGKGRGQCAIAMPARSQG
jgi:hypothetical protein